MTQHEFLSKQAVTLVERLSSARSSLSWMTSILDRHRSHGETVQLTVKSVFRTISMLAVAAVIGVTAATFTTCGVGLVRGTGTWCALPLVWFIGFPLAIIWALIFGLPLALLFWKLRLTRWWQFGMTGFVCAIPMWFELALPFKSVRWAHSGLYDSLNYLGSGLAGGLAHWWICQKVGIRKGNDEMGQEANPHA